MAKNALRELMGKIPKDEELYRILFAFSDGTPIPDSHDRTVAIVGAAAVEHGLRLAIERHLSTERDEDEVNRLFSDRDYGVLAPFSARIEMGFALGICSDAERKRFHLVRQIRNLFAHRAEHLSFDREPVLSASAPLWTWFDGGGLASLLAQKNGTGAFKFALTCASMLAVLAFHDPKGERESTLGDCK